MKILRSILILLCIFLFGVTDGLTQMTSDEALSEFIAAGIAYKDGRYDEAINRYEGIYSASRVNGPLHYNLGNSYFKKGNLGKTILNYERARQFIPRDSDLNFNYHYVRLQIKQPIALEGENFIRRAIQGHIQFYTIDEMVMILTGLGLMIATIFLISLYVNWPRTVTRGMITLLSVGFFVYGLGLMVKVDHERDTAVIMTPTESYFEPRSDSTLHFKLSEGGKIKILKAEGNWVKIKRLDGKIGWVDRNTLERISP